MLTSGREFSIEQLKINLVGGPLQSYNFLECKTFFFSILIKTNLPSLFIPSPLAASLVYWLLSTGPQGDSASRVLMCPCGLIYMVLRASPRPHYPLRTPNGLCCSISLHGFLLCLDPKWAYCQSVTFNHDSIMAVFNSWREMGTTCLSLLLCVKT